jgi:hypothetical protein
MGDDRTPMSRTPPYERPTSWWLAALKKRRERMVEETLDLREPIVFGSEGRVLATLRR